MRRNLKLRTFGTILGLAGLAGLAGCGAKHHLSRYDFAGRTLAIVHVAPSSGDLRLGTFSAAAADNPAGALIAAGSRLAVEVEARRIRSRLDSAATRIGVGVRLADRTAERTSMYLGAQRVQGLAAADYVLDMRVLSFGVSARNWQSAARLYLEADVTLVDTATGTEIWTTHVNGWDNITPSVSGTSAIPQDIVTAAGLLTVSLADLERSLQRVIDVSADAVTDELREQLRDVRNDRR